MSCPLLFLDKVIFPILLGQNLHRLDLEEKSKLKIENPSHGFKIRFNKLNNLIKAVLDKHI